MSTTALSRAVLRGAAPRAATRRLTTASTSTSSSAPTVTSGPTSAPPTTSTSTPTPTEPTLQSPPPNTHFKITLRRSGISMGKKVQGTLLALGFHRRHQTVFHAHGPEAAGKILRVKELVEVVNVPTHAVMTPGQQRRARAAPRGYKVVGTRRGAFMGV